MSYDPDFDKDPTKFYAGDLRSWGVELPERFPDCANVNRTAVIFGEPTTESTPEEIEKGMITTSIPVRFTEPFEWVTIKLGGKGEPTSDEDLARMFAEASAEATDEAIIRGDDTISTADALLKHIDCGDDETTVRVEPEKKSDDDET